MVLMVERGYLLWLVLMCRKWARQLMSGVNVAGALFALWGYLALAVCEVDQQSLLWMRSVAANSGRLRYMSGDETLHRVQVG